MEINKRLMDSYRSARGKYPEKFPEIVKDLKYIANGDNSELIKLIDAFRYNPEITEEVIANTKSKSALICERQTGKFIFNEVYWDDHVYMENLRRALISSAYAAASGFILGVGSIALGNNLVETIPLAVAPWVVPGYFINKITRSILTSREYQVIKREERAYDSDGKVNF